jgi:hypothetical protein
MKKYKVKVKHDNGTQHFYVFANSEDAAIQDFCRLELAPKNAIQSIKLMPYYVTMTDKFMSGWGMAEGKTNKFIVVCETYMDAEIVQRNAEKRNEMKYINITDKKPRYGNNVVESWRNFDELGQIWKN